MQGYLNENWDKMQDVVDNNAEELMQAQKDISTLKEDNKTNKSSIDVLEKSNETRDGKISKNTEDIEAIQGSIKTATETINKKDNEQDGKITLNKESIKEIQAENERLREDIKSVATIGEASGGNIHIEDSSNARCELEIGGNQKQETREGYNQFKITSTQTQSAGVTITKIDESSVSYQGTTTGMFTHMLVEYDGKGLEITKQMYLKAFGNLTNAILSVKLIKNGKTESSYLRVSPDLILSAGDVLQQIYVQQQNTGILVSGTLQVLLTDYENKDKPYEQYGASPSPDFPSPVKSVGNIKNILDMSNAKNGDSAGIICTTNADGSYKYKGTATSQYINVWFMGGYATDLPTLFTLEPGTYYINDVSLFEGTTGFANDSSKKIWTFIRAYNVTGVRAPNAVSGNTYDETKYPIIAKIDHEIPWVPYDCGYAKVNIQNKNIAPIFNLGTNWKYTDKGIKNTITSAEKEITKFKLKAGQTIKIGFKLFSKPSQDTTFTWYVNNVSNIISSFGHIDRTTFELNKIYTRTYTAKEECVIRSKMFGNANNDIFEFQVWAEYDNLTEYKKYEERQVLQETSTVARANWIDPTNDVFGLQIGKTNATGESKLGNIKKNLICFNCTSLNNNLAKYKLSLTESEIAEKNIKRLEQPNSEKLQLTPEISEIRMTVCGKIESKDKKFSNYVVLYSLYGFMSSIENRLIESTEKENKRITNYTTHLVENSLDESFNLSELYITMEGKLYNSTVKKVSSGYKISYNNLISIDDMYSQK